MSIHFQDEPPAVDTGERQRNVWHQLTARGELAVGSGAIIGVGVRYWLGLASQQHVPQTFPVGTLLINLLGCLLIGVLQTLFLDLISVRRDVQLALVVGVLGGFTTFSTFGVETVQLLQFDRIGVALLYQALSLIGGVLAAALGVALAHNGHRGWAQRRGARR